MGVKISIFPICGAHARVSGIRGRIASTTRGTGQTRDPLHVHLARHFDSAGVGVFDHDFDRARFSTRLIWSDRRRTRSTPPLPRARPPKPTEETPATGRQAPGTWPSRDKTKPRQPPIRWLLFEAAWRCASARAPRRAEMSMREPPITIKALYVQLPGRGLSWQRPGPPRVGSHSATPSPPI